MTVAQLASHLGPATVTARDGSRLRLLLDGRPVWATLALAVPYAPRIDDVVLVIGQDEVFYVIGLLSGSGPTTIEVPGDLDLRAPRGSITLSAARGVRLSGDEVALTGRRVQLSGESLVERFGDTYRWVRELVHERLGRLRRVVAGDSHLEAERVVVRARADVHLDGERINLG